MSDVINELIENRISNPNYVPEISIDASGYIFDTSDDIITEEDVSSDDLDDDDEDETVSEEIFESRFNSRY